MALSVNEQLELSIYDGNSSGVVDALNNGADPNYDGGWNRYSMISLVINEVITNPTFESVAANIVSSLIKAGAAVTDENLRDIRSFKFPTLHPDIYDSFINELKLRESSTVVDNLDLDELANRFNKLVGI